MTVVKSVVLTRNRRHLFDADITRPGPDRRLNSLPKAVGVADVARLLDSCDRETVADVAISR